MDICVKCDFELSDENVYVSFEERGVTCKEPICTGYLCPNCGHEELF